MKKVIIIIAFIVSTITINANNTIENNLNKERKTPELSEKIGIFEKDFLSCTETHIVYYNGKRVSDFTVELEDGDPNCGGIVIHYLKKLE